MNTLVNLISKKVSDWATQEKAKSQSAVGLILKHIDSQDKLRLPQRQAIEVYLWLKFVGQNQKLSELVKQGLLYDEAVARQYDNFHTFGDDYITQFLNQFFQDNKLTNLQKKLANDPEGEEVNWGKVLGELLYLYQYPNYLFSLPMGAGKTYLMACFIYLDLYFGRLYKNDKRFAHNFIVFAPQASKTAILPSLQTIKNFEPEWILPAEEASRLKQIIQIEILDALSSQRKDKLQGNNPNLEKVNRITQSKDFGMVFITNAEKVVLERYADKDKALVDPNSLEYDEKKASEIKKYNELRDGLAKIPYLGVVLDEVHHTYGMTKASQKEEKKLRKAIDIINKAGNVIAVSGFSGTPYVRHDVTIGKDKIKLNQIQDIVYHYSLNSGIGKFLKIPEIISADVKEKVFVSQTLSDFFRDFDVTYPNKTKSKTAFYCPSIKSLNEDVLPVVQEWYKKNRPGKEGEILRFYRGTSKQDKRYELPKENQAIFNNLDKPYSKKRVILLVGIGTEGWDCRSLTSVALPRQKTTKNFVLQTTCRCLREVEDAGREKALVYLAKENYETLNNELQENYRLQISDLKPEQTHTIKVKIRKPKLGKLKYKQVIRKYKIVLNETANPKQALQSFRMEDVKQASPFERRIKKGKIGDRGITDEVSIGIPDNIEIAEYNFDDFVYDLAKYTLGKFSESELATTYQKELQTVFEKIDNEKDWIATNPKLELADVVKVVASRFMDTATYETEEMTANTEIELLEWKIKEPEMLLQQENGRLFDFVPDFNDKQATVYERHPEDLERDFFEDNNIDPQDVSFNYIPYKVDSAFEQNALLEMVKLSELKGLEVYFNGYTSNKLHSFWIETPRGRYTPDFLVIKRTGGKKYKSQSSKGEVEKILIIETKGSPYYDESFRAKERFVQDSFLKHNKNFDYQLFLDKEGDNNFSRFVDTLINKIKSL